MGKPTTKQPTTMSGDGMLPPEAKKMKIVDHNGIFVSSQELEKLVINCKDRKKTIVWSPIGDR